jgi:probable O-glycosylation ligase (exosortase A-associated)
MVLGVVWLIFTGRRRVRGFVIAGSLALLVLTFAPSSWLDRMDTIQTADQDASFLGRVEAWQISSAIALANPVLGGGFHSLETPEVWGMFRGNTGLLGFLPPYEYQPVNFRAAHSAYFEVLGDRGILGFILFILILVNILLTASESKRLAKAIGPNMNWAVDLANALSASAIAFMVGGGGVSVAYSEMFYVIAMLTEVLKHHIVEVGKSKTASIG